MNLSVNAGSGKEPVKFEKLEHSLPYESLDLMVSNIVVLILVHACFVLVFMDPVCKSAAKGRNL
jgi:hypothetical protein